MEKELKNKLDKILTAQNKIIHIQNNKNRQLRSEIKQLKKSKNTNDYIPMDYSSDAISYVQLTEEEQDHKDKNNIVKQKQTENLNVVFYVFGKIYVWSKHGNLGRSWAFLGPS